MSCSCTRIVRIGNGGPSLVVPLVAGNAIAEHTSSDGVQETIFETITTLVANGDGTYTYTSEDGTQTVLPAERVSSVVQTLPTGQLIAVHNDGDGNDVSVFESITTLVANGDGTYTYTSENGTQTVLPAERVSSVAQTLPTGQVIAVHNDGDGNDTSVFESITTLIDNGDGTYTYTSETGVETNFTVGVTSSVSQTLPTGQLIGVHSDGDGNDTSIFETVTSLVANGDGTYTYTSEDGTETSIPAEIMSSFAQTLATGNLIGVHSDGAGNDVSVFETITALADNGDGSFTFTSENGTATTIPAPSDTISSVAQTVTAGNQIATHSDGDGNSTPILETITTLVLNGDGSFTYTSEDGTETDIPPEIMSSFAQTLATGNLIGVHSDGDGNDVSVFETITSLVDNGDGSFTFTSENGTATTIPAPSDTISSVAQTVTAGNQIATHSDGDGNSTPILETVTTLVLNGDGSFTYTSEDGTETDIPPEIMSSFAQTLATGNLIGVHSDGDGNDVSVFETITSLADNGDGSFTFTSENGTATTIPAPSDTISSVTQTVSAGNQIATHSDGDGNNVDIFETVTTLVDNGDGTYTYSSENGTQTTITAGGGGAGTTSAVTQTVTAGNEIASHSDGNGVTTSIIETVTTLVQNANGTYTYTNEAGTDVIFDPCCVDSFDATDPADPASWVAEQPDADKKSFVCDGDKVIGIVCDGAAKELQTPPNPLATIAVEDTNGDDDWTLTMALAGGDADCVSLRITDAVTGQDIYPRADTAVGADITLPDGSAWTVGNGSVGTWDTATYLNGLNLGCQEILISIYAKNTVCNLIGPEDVVNFTIGCTEPSSSLNQLSADFGTHTDAEFALLDKAGGNATVSVDFLGQGQTLSHHANILHSVLEPTSPFFPQANPILTTINVTNTNGIVYLLTKDIDVDESYDVTVSSPGMTNLGAWTKVELTQTFNNANDRQRRGAVWWAPVLSAGSGDVHYTITANAGSSGPYQGSSLWHIFEIDNVDQTNPFLQSANPVWLFQGGPPNTINVFEATFATEPTCPILGAITAGHVETKTVGLPSADNSTDTRWDDIPTLQGRSYGEACNSNISTSLLQTPIAGQLNYVYRKTDDNASIPRESDTGLFELNCLQSAGGSATIDVPLDICLTPPCLGGAQQSHIGQYMVDTGPITIELAPLSDFTVELLVNGAVVNAVTIPEGFTGVMPGLAKSDLIASLTPDAETCVTALMRLTCNNYDDTATNSIAFGNGSLSIATF